MKKININLIILSFLLTLIALSTMNIKLDIFMKLSIIIIIFFSSYKIIEYIISKKDNLKFYNIFYIIIVFFIFLFPVIKIDNNEKDVIENRNLNKKSSIYSAKGINLNFGKDTENWLKDHFYKRKFILAINKKINSIIASKTNTKKIENKIAFLGEEDWIFYKGDNSIKNYQNIKLFSNNELDKIKNNLIKRKKSFELKNIKYYTFIAPDKNKIYGKYYPKYIKKFNSYGKAKQLQIYLEKESQENNIIYPYDILLNKGEKDLTYYKTDTHWNTYGAYLGYLDLIKEIKKNLHDIEEVKENDLDIKFSPYEMGDLLTMLPIDKKNYENILYKTLLLKKENFEYIKNEDINRVVTVSPKKYKILIIGDSFSIGMIPYIAQTFGQVYSVHINKIDSEDLKKIIADYKPDIIVHELVEREIGTLFIDFENFRKVGEK